MQQQTSVAFDCGVIVHPVGESIKTKGTFRCCCTPNQCPAQGRERCDGEDIRSGLWLPWNRTSARGTKWCPDLLEVR